MMTNVMKKMMTVAAAVLVAVSVSGQSFETATEAVKHMGVGWNLGNTLDAHAGGQHQGLDSEIYWGQPYTKPELMTMLKAAGFGAMRIPVTWYNHMNAQNQVDAAWMARVKQVVDYVLDAGMYCILNVHHDTGDGNTHWLHASMDTYNSTKARYEALWQQVAETFKDYDQRLLFESYNEMLDKYNSWNFATFNRPGGYDSADAADAYQAINSYAQSFVSVVRATGGNNARRNLVVNTYGACNGAGTWNAHLKEPLTQMVCPTDPAGSGHIAFQVHAYPNIANLQSAKNELTQMFNALNTHLVSKGGPVIVGEWGSSNVDAGVSDYDADREKFLAFVTDFVQKAKAGGFGMFYWMGLSDGTDRSLPAFTQPDAAEAMLKAWYGTDYQPVLPTRDDFGTAVYQVSYSQLWGEANVLTGGISTADCQRLEVELSEAPAAGAFQLKVYDKGVVIPVTSATTILTFNAATMGATIPRITLQSCVANGQCSVKEVRLVKKDGTVVKQRVSPFWGCTVEETFTSSVQVLPLAVAAADAPCYDLMGRRVLSPVRGLYIRNGRKVLIR